MVNTTAVLLAAGAGTRLGRGPKALLVYRAGTLVEHAAAVLRDGGCSGVAVVVGAGAGEVAELSGLAGCRLVPNDDWASGMGGSFRLGVAAAAAGNNVLVALVDQPGMSAALVARLITAHRPGRITAAGYGTHDQPGGLHRGHPIIFDSELAARAAATSTGDAGAREFLRANPELIDLVDCRDLSDGADLDTDAELYLLDGPSG
ncbi:molybdenum cofactor cytidylyltransferase [Arthrobacter livingstonensis]|uniref:Molybdenum cofactor cytidylyltransferase n=1 Tax=Arthrobacter livingstonensis TaxID=670078 RepID=A0A2V5LWY1_9MICC|nr:NTP transferase domain-containing protein [Arthrobacter livingstonensis]PYI68237.1 molybdenum cofactor cytidylyltransferase [Arthrobacter livingstonensis]